MKPIVPVLFLISALWILGGSWWMSKTACGPESTTVSQLSFVDGEFEASSDQHFSFLISSSKVGMPEGVGIAMQKVADHLKDNPDRILQLKGLYMDWEKNISDFDNLGIARAEDVKDFLLKSGAPPSQLITIGELKENLPTPNNKVVDGVSFSFLENENVPKEASADPPGEPTLGEDDIGVPPLLLKGRSYNLALTPALQHHIDMFLSYLDQHPGSIISVTGHTEDLGNEKKNKYAGLKRADKVRRFFRNNGVRSAQIKAFSDGAKNPLVEVDHPKADIQNNRVVVSIKKAE